MSVVTREVRVTCTRLAINPADVSGPPLSVPFTGQVIFVPALRNGKLLDLVEQVSLGVEARAVYVDGGGVATAQLVTTDNPDQSPVDWTWAATFDLAEGVWDSFNFDLPVGDGSTLDLTTVTPVPDATGAPIVAGPRGPEGPEGPEGPTGPAGGGATVTDNGDGTGTLSW